MAAVETEIHDMLRTGPTARGHGLTPVMSLMREVENGIAVTAVYDVARAIAPDDGSFVFRIIPKATLSRRRKAVELRGRAEAALTPEEGGRVARVAEVWAAAMDVWKSEADARAFLFRAHPLLEGKRPIDVVLASEYGRPVVLDIIGRLKHGTAV